MSSNDIGREDEQGSVEPVSPGPDDVPVSEPGDAPVAEPPTDNTAAGESEGPAEQLETANVVSPVDEKPRRRRRVRKALRRFFVPQQGSSFWRRALPFAAVLAIVAGVVVGSAHAWDWTNSPEFCGEFCHTMPPQYAAYKISPHSRVSCVECHIGRDFIGKQLPRKAVHSRFIFQMAFGLYEYPIYAKGMRPARDACETCHAPDKFSDDSVRINQHYRPDESNTPYSNYLVMKTSGGTEREGLSRGIHWHIENKVEFLSTDFLDQDIPFVRVTNSDGSVDEYVDIEADFDPSSVDQDDLKTMDCITCHNRISHSVASPVDSIESSMATGAISTDIPYIRDLGVQVLVRDYASQEEADAGIEQALDSYYQNHQPEFYAEHGDQVQEAIEEIQRIYSVSVFKEQEIDWNTHPDNSGHQNSPGCFRCHDGKHLNAADEAVRLECNLCHSIPIVVGPDENVTDIEISSGPEPESHLNPNWISLHNRAYDATCANCHTTEDDGGTSNTSFCSNSACHGETYPYAGFDAPSLRERLQGQLPPATSVTPTPGPSDVPTYDSFFGPLLATKCGSCHNASPTAASAGLNLTSYEGLMKGSTNGPVVVPGNSAESRLVQVQSRDHFSNLSDEELEAVIDWIDAGAPER